MSKVEGARRARPGSEKGEMYFLPDIYVECEECHGKRYNKEVLEITYKDKNIAISWQ